MSESLTLKPGWCAIHGVPEPCFRCNVSHRPDGGVELDEDVVNAMLNAGIGTQVLDVDGQRYTFAGRGTLSGTWRWAPT